MKISLLSAVHNEAAFLRELIVSVQHQTHEDWELLLVDDGSTDATAELAASSARDDPRVRLVAHGHKIGKVRAFNRAYGASTGQVVALTGGDDILPPDSLATRAAAFAEVDAAAPTVAFFKLRTFSTERRFDGMVLPRGRAANRSGGSITMNRALADRIFPIDEDLVSEDIWLAHAAGDQASTVIERPEVVLNYRIHPGNSNPRAQPFAVMTHAMNARHRAYHALLHASHLHLRPSTRAHLQRLWEAEQLRYDGQTLRLLVRSRLPFAERAAFASMSNPALFGVRSRFYKFFSGRRGR